MSSLSEDIVQLLGESQSNVHSHQRLLKSFTGLYEKHQECQEEFFEAFFKPFSNVLVVYKREATAMRVLEFVAKCAISTAPLHPEDSQTVEDSGDDSDCEPAEEAFFHLLLHKLLSLHNAQWKGTRFRVCQLVSRLLTLSREEGCVVGAGLLDRVQTVMLERVLDKVPIVRVQAVSALEWLQSADQDCPISHVYLSLLATDPSPDVRRCVLNKIELYDRSLAALIERTRDVKDVIRREAFLKLAEKCSIRHFKIKQRIQLLSDGLNDDSELVQEACVNGLLRKWSLESNDGDFLSLLARLDVESSSEVTGLALTKLFDNFTVAELVSSMEAMIAGSHAKPEVWGEETLTNSPSVTPSRESSSHSNQATPTPVTDQSPKVISLTELHCEEVFYWARLCLYLHDKGSDDQLERILPTASEFCDYVQRYIEEVLLTGEDTEESIKSEFVVQQLLAMLPVLDPADEVGGRRLAKLVCDMMAMPTFPIPLIGHMLTQQTKIWPQESHRVEVFLEVIADLRAPFNITTDSTLNSTALLSQTVSCLEPKEDTSTLLRCLTISAELLRELRPQPLSSTLRMLKDALLIPCVQNVDPYVRDMAVFSLGLLALLDVGTAREHLLLLVQVSQVDHESVQATALKVVLDLLHVYGFEAFNIDSEDQEKAETASDDSTKDSDNDPVPQSSDPSEVSEGTTDQGDRPNDTMQRLLNIMINFLEGESSVLSQVSAEGIAKLLLSRRVLSQKLLAKLLVLWYNPVLQDEARLRALLGGFFPLFAASDRSCRECLGEVYLPVLSSVFEAPPTSPLYEIDVGNMADFIIHLTQPRSPDEECIHDNLAYAVCNTVLSDPGSSDVRVYTRSLSQMTFSPTNQSNAEGLLELCDQMKRGVTDKISLKYIDKLRDSLMKIAPNYKGAVDEGSALEEAAKVLTETSHNIMTPLLKQTKRGAKPRAKTTVKKTQRSVPRTTKTTEKTGRHKKVVKKEEMSSEGSESENLEPPAETVPMRITSTRKSKTAAVAKLDQEAAKKALMYGSEDSDDSLVGEHSPFVRHTASRGGQTTSEPHQSLQFDENT